jgi:hypothetical protein
MIGSVLNIVAGLLHAACAACDGLRLIKVAEVLTSACYREPVVTVVGSLAI